LAVLVVLVRRHRRAVGAAVRRALDGEVPGAIEEETGPAAVCRVLPGLLDALPVHALGALDIAVLLMAPAPCLFMNIDRGALRGTPSSACPQPEPNATELPSSAPGRPKLIKPQATSPSPTPTRAEEDIATTPGCLWTCRPPRLRPRRHAKHLAGLQIVRLLALAHRRAPCPPARAEEDFARRRAADLAALRALAHADSHRRKLRHAPPS